MQSCCLLSASKSIRVDIRQISCSNRLWKSYYDILGVSKNCTTKEVKAAYFKLSKRYHPDRNDGSVEAADKFRDISAAYEVLKNTKLRREYDRDGPVDYQRPTVKQERRDPEVVRPYYGKTAHFDYDAWERAHYSETFARKQYAKARYEYREQHRKSAVNDRREERAFFSVFLLFLAVTIAMSLDISSKDDPRPVKREDR